MGKTQIPHPDPSIDLHPYLHVSPMSSGGHDQIMIEFCSTIVCSIIITARSCSTIIEYKLLDHLES